MQIREPSAQDLDALLAFFARVPESERTFFKGAVLDRALSRAGCGDRGRRAARARRRRHGGGLRRGDPAHGLVGPRRDLRLVVDPAHRGQGLGRALARWALLQAIDCGLSKLTVEVVAEQDGAVAMFTALGFQAEALLRDHVRDRDGELRDLVLLPLGGRRVVGDGDRRHRRRARVNCRAIRVGETTAGPRAAEHRGAGRRGLDLRADPAALPGAERARGRTGRRWCPASDLDLRGARRARPPRRRGRARRLGIGEGDRAAVLLPNTAPMLELTYAAPGVRGVLVPLNTRLAAPEYEYILEHSGAKVLVADNSFKEMLELDDTPRIVYVDEYEELLEAADPVDALERPDDERTLISINYTSGTTGKPKGVMTNHRGAYLHALGVIAEAASRRAAPTCGRCRCSTATAGRIRGRSPRWAPSTSACPRSRPSRSGARSPRRASPTCAPRRRC